MMYSLTRMMWHHVRSQLAAAAFLLASAAVVFGQSAPPTMPPNTVYGRLGGGTSGPGQAIPFATLTTQLFPIISQKARLPLTGNLVMYVNGNAGSSATCGPAGVSTCSPGVDTGNCSTPATACLTLQYAHNLIIASIDFAYQYAGNIYLAHNIGTTNYNLVSVNGPWVGTGVINVVGDSSAADTATTITMPAGGAAVQCKDLCTIFISHVACADNGTNNGAQCFNVGGTGNSGHLDLANVTLGACTICTQLAAGSLGSMAFIGPITVAGGAAISFEASDGGKIDPAGQTVTVSGTPAFSTAFAYMPNSGVITATNVTFSGSATGPKCLIVGAVNMSGFAPDAVFPGNSACQITAFQGVNTAIGVTFAKLPSPVAGMYGYITDGKASNCGDSACTTWGTTVTAGTGALKLLVWYNGTNWTLAGK